MTDRAFILDWDLSRVSEDIEFSAVLTPFPDSQRALRWSTQRELPVPDPVHFTAIALEVDYPDNNVYWPIMSRRMRDVLLPRSRAHRVIRCDLRARDEQIGDYAAVQLLDYVAALDGERSSFTTHDSGRIARLERLELVDTELPWLFRLAEYPHPLFVSTAGRAALDADGISGASYRPLSEIESW